MQLLYSLSYVGFLILMVGFLAGRAAYKGVVENYRESVYILITAVVTVPVALSWTVAGWMLQVRSNFVWCCIKNIVFFISKSYSNFLNDDTNCREDIKMRVYPLVWWPTV